MGTWSSLSANSWRCTLGSYSFHSLGRIGVAWSWSSEIRIARPRPEVRRHARRTCTTFVGYKRKIPRRTAGWFVCDEATFYERFCENCCLGSDATVSASLPLIRSDLSLFIVEWHGEVCFLSIWNSLNCCVNFSCVSTELLPQSFICYYVRFACMLIKKSNLRKRSNSSWVFSPIFTWYYYRGILYYCTTMCCPITANGFSVTWFSFICRSNKPIFHFYC